MPQTVIERLAASEDPLERELSACLSRWQEAKRTMGKPARIGYEPRDINALGAVEVISRRVLAGSSGFEEVGEHHSYEAIVDRYPSRFADDVLRHARARLATQSELYGPTPSRREYESRMAKLLRRPFADAVPGVETPDTTSETVTRYCRLPKVGVMVLRRASGHCELCTQPAPFDRPDGTPYLEVHHVRHLADGGSDRPCNAVAVCPNCHRALHYAAHREALREALYSRIQELKRE